MLFDSELYIIDADTQKAMVGRGYCSHLDIAYSTIIEAVIIWTKHPIDATVVITDVSVPVLISGLLHKRNL